MIARRKIIQIDRGLCNGCGLCITACAEGALKIDSENKATLVKEIYCDGLGACLNVCPTGALTIVDREARRFDPDAAHKYVPKARRGESAHRIHSTGKNHAKLAPQDRTHADVSVSSSRLANRLPEDAPSELRPWPIQLHLVSPHASRFRRANLLIAADCTAFVLETFHRDLLQGKHPIIACPKLDRTEGYAEKLAEIISLNKPRSLTVVTMTVPCCAGLYRIVQTALSLSGANIKLKKRQIHIDGRLVE